MAQIVPISYCGLCRESITSYDPVLLPSPLSEEPNPNMGIALECDKTIFHIFHARCLNTSLTTQETLTLRSGFIFNYETYKNNCPICEKQITCVEILNPDPSKICKAAISEIGNILVTVRSLNPTTATPPKEFYLLGKTAHSSPYSKIQYVPSKS